MGDCTVINGVAVLGHITTVSGVGLEARDIQHTVGCLVEKLNVVADSKKRILSKQSELTGKNMLEIIVRSLSTPAAAVFHSYNSTLFLLFSDHWLINVAAKHLGDHIICDPAGS